MVKLDDTKEDLETLRKTMTNTEIALLKGVSLSMVKRKIRALGISMRPLKVRPESDKEKQHREDLELLGKIADFVNIRDKPTVDAGIGLMDRCKEVLGNRMGENKHNYILDGRPASSAQVVKAAGLTFGKVSR